MLASCVYTKNRVIVIVAVSVSIFLYFLANMVSAAPAPPPTAVDEVTRITDVVRGIIVLVNILSFIAIGLAFLYFFYNLATSILQSDSIEKRAEAYRRTVWGIIAIFILVSIWGIMQFLGSLIFGSNVSGVSFVIPIPETIKTKQTLRSGTGTDMKVVKEDGTDMKIVKEGGTDMSVSPGGN